MQKFITLFILSFFLLIECSSVPVKIKTLSNVSLIKVYKSKRILEAYEDGVLVKSFSISLGRNPKGHKQFEGDNKTPEGNYFIDGKNPNSKYHKNLGISYPNNQDRKFAKAAGKSAGGDIKIHGLPNGKGEIGKAHLLSDWTAGCIALTNAEIDELYAAVKYKTPIQIYP